MTEHIRKFWTHFKSDSLFRNSVYLILSTGVLAALGFVFWIFVARLFSVKNVGIATTLVAASSLLSSLALLGFNTSLIRYLPSSNKKNDKINSTLLLVLLASVVIASAFLVGLKVLSPQLLFLQQSYIYLFSFVFFVLVASLNTIIESVFIAYRASGNVLIKNTTLALLKLVFPIFFLFWGAYGIFSAYMLAMAACCLVGFVILFTYYGYRPALAIDGRAVKDMAFFSAGNYLAGFLSQAPNLIFPLLIVNLLNAEAAAYFYVSSMIMNFLLVISQSTTQAFLAEGSHNISSSKNFFVKSIKIVSLFLIPAIVLIFFFGNILLHAFGKRYATGSFTFLQIISISTIFISICYLGNSILRIKHKIAPLVVLNAFGAFFTLIVTYFYIPHGLIALGWSFLVTQVIISGVYFVFFWKQKLI